MSGTSSGLHLKWQCYLRKLSCTIVHVQKNFVKSFSFLLKQTNAKA